MSFKKNSQFLRIVVVTAGIAVLSPAATKAQSSQSQTPAADANQSELAEIMVTATRREEREQDVPISITAISAVALEQVGVTSTQDLTLVVPGLKMDRVGAFTEPSIRGVSTQLTNAGTDANVAVYVDGVYQPSQETNTFDFADISHIEVDKGPQGTLFGRNVVGGAIQVFTKDPTSTPSGSISATFGSFNQRGVNGFISGPLGSSALTGSLSALYNKDDGYYHNVLTGDSAGGKETVSLRAKLKDQISDTASVIFTAFYNHADDASSDMGAVANGNTVARGVPGAIYFSQPYNVAYNSDVVGLQPNTHTIQAGGSVRATQELPVGTFTATLSGTNVNAVVGLDGDYAYTPAGGPFYHQITSERTYTGEINFASRQFDDWFNFVTGLFIYYDDANYNPELVEQNLAIPQANSYSITIWGSQNDFSYAGYWEGTAKVTDRLTAVAGVRYSWENRQLDGPPTVFQPAFTADQLIRPAASYRYDSRTWHAVTPRVSLRYALDPSTNVYASYSQGFKSGAFNPTSLPFAPPPAKASAAVDPEKLDAYEIGLKTTLWNRLTLDSSIFYYIYKDEQVNSFVDLNGVPLSVLTNAASAKMYGLDLEGHMAWTESFSTRAGFSYLHARYSNYPDAVVNVPAPAGGNDAVTADVSGNHMIRSPDWTLSISGNYKIAFQPGTLNLSANVYHSDKVFFEVGNRIQQPQYTTVGAQAQWVFGDSGFDVSVWGKNLTNKEVIEGAFIIENADGLSYAPPRSGGVTARYRF